MFKFINETKARVRRFFRDRLDKRMGIFPINIIGKDSFDVRFATSLVLRRPIVTELTVASSVTHEFGFLIDQPEALIVDFVVEKRLSKCELKELIVGYRNLLPDISAAEWLGLDKKDAPCLVDMPRNCTVLPWDIETPQEMACRLTKAICSEHHLSLPSDCIPFMRDAAGRWADEAFVDIETERLYSLTCSINDKGYLRSDSCHGDINAYCLTDECGLVWISKSGNHRARVVAGLGFESVPVRVHAFVDRRHASFWPNVQRGGFSEEGALKLFDRIRDGMPAPHAKNVKEHVRQMF